MKWINMKIKHKHEWDCSEKRGLIWAVKLKTQELQLKHKSECCSVKRTFNNCETTEVHTQARNVIILIMYMHHDQRQKVVDLYSDIYHTIPYSEKRRQEGKNRAEWWGWGWGWGRVGGTWGKTTQKTTTNKQYNTATTWHQRKTKRSGKHPRRRFN